MLKSLAEIVREKIDSGILPRDQPVKLLAHEGHGEPCTACEQPIFASQIEREPQYEGRGPIRLHVGCHGVWEEERRRRGYRPKD